VIRFVVITRIVIINKISAVNTKDRGFNSFTLSMPFEIPFARSISVYMEYPLKCKFERKSHDFLLLDCFSFEELTGNCVTGIATAAILIKQKISSTVNLIFFPHNLFLS